VAGHQLRFLDPDTKKFDGFHILMFAALLAIVAWGIVGVIVWSP
jgi:hypothetical protein